MCRPASLALPTPRVAVLIGGPNGEYAFDERRRSAAWPAALARACSARRGLDDFAVAPHAAGISSAIDAATAGAPRILYDGKGDNPYAEFPRPRRRVRRDRR